MSNRELRRTALRGMVALAAGMFAPGMHAAVAAALPPLPEGLSAPPKAASMPAFSLAAAAGGTMRAEELRGKVVIARFWATWWDICVGEMPSVQRAHAEYQKSGVPVVAISIDGQGGQAVKPFLSEHKYTLPVGLDPEMQVARALGARVVPWTVIIDRNGAVAAGGYGRIDMSSPAFRNYVKALAAQKS